MRRPHRSTQEARWEITLNYMCVVQFELKVSSSNVVRVSSSRLWTHWHNRSHQIVSTQSSTVTELQEPAPQIVIRSQLRLQSVRTSSCFTPQSASRQREEDRTDPKLHHLLGLLMYTLPSDAHDQPCSLKLYDVVCDDVCLFFILYITASLEVNWRL